jgi:hypothetical protein
MLNSNFGAARNLTATGTVKATQGRLLGFYVNSTTSGTIVLRDGGGSGVVLTGTITPAVGWHPLPLSYATDLHATIGATIDVTFVVA